MNRLREWIDDSVVKTNSCLIEQSVELMIQWQYDSITHTDILECANTDKQSYTNS